MNIVLDDLQYKVLKDGIFDYLSWQKNQGGEYRTPALRLVLEEILKQERNKNESKKID